MVEQKQETTQQTQPTMWDSVKDSVSNTAESLRNTFGMNQNNENQNLAGVRENITNSVQPMKENLNLSDTTTTNKESDNNNQGFLQQTNEQISNTMDSIRGGAASLNTPNFHIERKANEVPSEYNLASIAKQSLRENIGDTSHGSYIEQEKSNQTTTNK
ncbi:hypothetical protein ABK040_009176 [Willaertia magna]